MKHLCDLPQALLQAVRLFFDCVRQQLSGGMNLHPRQGPVLEILLSRDGVSQAELSRELGITPATVAVSVARLEKNGLVRRERNALNQRANVLTLTDEGRQEALRVRDAFASVAESAKEGFTQEEIALFESYCSRIAHNLRRRYLSGEENTKTCTKC